MKVVAINGSPRKNGNTHDALLLMAGELKKEGIETEIVQVGDKHLHGCIACGHCFKAQDHLCVFKDDIVNETILKMRQADGIILASPTYYAGIAGTMKCFLDRAFYTDIMLSNFKNKPAATVAVMRRAGGTNTHDQLRHYLALAEMAAAPSQYWVAGFGMQPGELKEDKEGVQTIQKHAASLAWLMKSLEAAKDKVSLPAAEVRTPRD